MCVCVYVYVKVRVYVARVQPAANILPGNSRFVSGAFLISDSATFESPRGPGGPNVTLPLYSDRHYHSSFIIPVCVCVYVSMHVSAIAISEPFTCERRVRGHATV